MGRYVGGTHAYSVHVLMEAIQEEGKELLRVLLGRPGKLGGKFSNGPLKSRGLLTCIHPHTHTHTHTHTYTL